MRKSTNKNIKESEDLQEKYWHTFDEEEKRITRDIESGKYESVPFDKEKYAVIAKNHLHKLKKNKSISLRVPNQDLENLKQIAEEIAMPYQTMIGAILHQIAERKIEIKIEVN